MSNQTSLPSQTIDPYKHFHIILNPDGTLTRLDNVPNTLPSSDTTLPISVLSKDITINQSNNTWVRLFLPKNAIQNSHHNLPLIVFFHGSGFILASAANTVFHDFCVEMADTIGAVVASVEYRLAPEHRLPAAYEDAMEALFWIRSSQDEWLTRYADYSKCYVMGNSAGGTIAYHAGLRAVEEVNNLKPLKIQGLILRQPFFGGTERTMSELKHENDPVIPLSGNDMMWELALPIGADRDHEYCNLKAGNGVEKLHEMRELGWRVLVSGNGGDPLADRDHEYCNLKAGNGVEKLHEMRELGWRVLVSGNGGDPLVDREKELVRLMEEKGVQVVSDFQEEGSHGVEYSDPLKATQFIEFTKGFISSFDG